MFFLKNPPCWLEVALTHSQIETAAENPQKQHRGRGAQELSTRFARVDLIISPNVPVYCHLLLWQRAVWLCCWGDLLSPRQWLFVFVLLRAQKCNRHAANQATAALLSRRVIDAVMCQRSPLQESRRNQTGMENTAVLTAWYMTWGDGRIYSPQVCVHRDLQKTN